MAFFIMVLECSSHNLKGHLHLVFDDILVVYLCTTFAKSSQSFDIKKTLQCFDETSNLLNVSTIVCFWTILSKISVANCKISYFALCDNPKSVSRKNLTKLKIFAFQNDHKIVRVGDTERQA